IGGAVTGKVLISNSTSTTPLTLTLFGTGVAGMLSANPKWVNFGIVAVGSTRTLSQVIVNAASQVTISKVSVTGAGFTFSGLSLPLTLGAGQSYTFSISFTAKTSASVTGVLSMISNAQNSTFRISLSGSGATLTFGTPALFFGYVPVGSSKTFTYMLQANGSDIVISSVVSNSPEFVPAGITLPFTIKRGWRIPFPFSFKPQLAGKASGKISFVSNATNSPSLQVASGVGIAVHHKVVLQWAPSVSAVVGYNIFRGRYAAGPFAKINSVLDR